jgi:hypothetical protein
VTTLSQPQNRLLAVSLIRSVRVSLTLGRLPSRKPGNFNKVEKWSRDGQPVEEMLFAGNGLNYALPNALFELPHLCF